MNRSKPGGRSPRRRSSWTKHTSYPTLQNENAIHIPAEISPSTRANIRCAEKRLNTDTKRLHNIQRKNLSQLDAQRRLLEKSMLAYSEKMKDITNSRANDLFREICTSDSTRDDRRVKSPTASVRSHQSLPARLVPKPPNDYRSLQGFQRVNIYSPIAERSAECTPVSRTRSAPRRIHFNHQSDQPYSKPLKHVNSVYRNTNKDKVECSVSVEQEHHVDVCETIEKNKVLPRVLTGPIPWLKSDFSDSAYSSASEELDKDISDVTSEISVATEATSRTSIKNNDRNDQNILTVPVVHVRKRARKNRKKVKTILNTGKQNNLHSVSTESRICMGT